MARIFQFCWYWMLLSAVISPSKPASSAAFSCSLFSSLSPQGGAAAQTECPSRNGQSGTTIEANQHQPRIDVDDLSSRLPAANSMTAFTCSRFSPSSQFRMSLIFAAASKFSKATETGMRVPRSTQAPLYLSGDAFDRGALGPIQRRHEVLLVGNRTPILRMLKDSERKGRRGASIVRPEYPTGYCINY
jgi:hypothetical protein